MLVNLWKRKFNMEIRDFAAGDINDDGLDEILVASWDGRIYALDNNKLLWQSSEYEYPAENVELIFDSFGKVRTIVGTFHKKIVAFDVAGKKLWELILDSWVTHLFRVSSSEGIDKILAVDLRGKMYLINGYSGDVEWFIEKDIDGIIAPIRTLNDNIIIGNKAGIIFILGNDGKVISKKKLVDSQILSIDAISHDILGGNKLIAGYEKGAILVDLDTLKIESKFKFKNQEKFGFVRFCPLNANSEVIAILGAWKGDKANILRFDDEKKKFLLVKRLTLDGNLLHAYCVDLDGSLSDKIILSDDRGNITIFDSKSYDLVDKIEGVASIHGFLIANTLGFGRRDIIYRETRESLSCVALVPRINIEFNKELTGGVLRAFIPAGSRLDIDKIISLDTEKRKYLRKTINKRTYSYYEYPFQINYHGKLLTIKVQDRKSVLLISKLPIPTREKRINEFVYATYLAEEDVLLLKDVKIKSKRNIVIDSRNIKVHKFEVTRDKSSIKVFTTLSNLVNISDRDKIIINANIIIKEKQAQGTETIIKKYNFYIWPIRSIDIRINGIEKIMSTQDKLKLVLMNNANKRMLVQIRSKGPLKVNQEVILEPTETKIVDLLLNIASDELVIPIKTPIIIEYGEFLRRIISIPLDLRLLNARSLQEKAKRMYLATKDLNLVIETLSSELNVDESYIKKILGNIDKAKK